MRAHRCLLSDVAACAASRAINARTAARAHSSFVIRFLSGVSLRKQAGAFGLALEGLSAPVGAHQKGKQVLGIHALTFASREPVQQPVHRLDFSRGQPWITPHCSANSRCSHAWRGRTSCRLS